MPNSKGRFAKLTSWSFSTYTQYIRCPFSVCLAKIQRVRIEEPPDFHLVKGNSTHAIADAFISGRGKRPKLVETINIAGLGMPVKLDLRSIEDELKELRAKKARTEQEWAFDRQYNAVDWRDWDRAWLRIKTDVCADTVTPPTVDIVDWKTGRPHPEDHRLQRRLYALGGLQLVKLGVLAGGSKDTTLTARHVYLEQPGVTATERFSAKQLPALIREWETRVKRMLDDTVYPAYPSANACRWCKFSAKRGGPCQKGVA